MKSTTKTWHKKIRLNPLNLARKFICIFPKSIWYVFIILSVLFTTFILGSYVGYIVANEPGYRLSALQGLTEKERKLDEVIQGYETLTQVFFMMSQDVSVILNIELWKTNPEEIDQSAQSLRDNRDIINIQLGRLMELRRYAGLREISYSKETQTSKED